MQALIEAKRSEEFFKVFIRVKGIMKRQRKIKPFMKEVFKLPLNYNDRQLTQAKDACLDWCEENLREVHNDMFLINQVGHDITYPSGDTMTAVMPFDDRNETLNLTRNG
jgi:hypothetical protein